MIIKPTDLLGKLNKLYATPLIRGHGTGWDKVDEHFTVKAGEFTVITGMPSHGKSEWLDNLVTNLAMNHNYRVAIFSPENHPLEQHAKKIIEKMLQKPFYGHWKMTQAEMEEATNAMNKNFAFINPSETEFTPTHIINEALPWLDQSLAQPRALIIDPWNEMDHYRPAGLNETEYISRILTELRRAAREYKTHLFLVAHPMKMQKDKDGNYPVPRPYDISGSAHWANKADNIIAIWRDVINNPYLTQVHIQKVRFKTTGSVGMVELVYDNEKSSYFEPKPFDNRRVA
jgi:twinkle protein